MKKKRAQIVIAPTVSAHHANAAKRLKVVNAVVAADNRTLKGYGCTLYKK